MSSEQIIVGIDPGTRITGYGIIKNSSPAPVLIDYGCIRPPQQLAIAERYLFIFRGVEMLLDQYKPQALAIETQFFSVNAQSAMKLGMARAVAMIAAASRQVPVYEYPPKKAKLAVAHGNASKEQVQKMIQLLLKLPQLPEPEDAADALAIALCHAHQESYRNIIGTKHHVRLSQR